MAVFFPIIKAEYSYYNDGNCRSLPPETPKGPCRLFVNEYSTDVLKNIIDHYAKKKDFLEMIVLHHSQTPDEFKMQDIIKFIEKERADQLQYRLANFLYQGKSYPAICVSQIHDGQELFQFLYCNQDERYHIILCSKNLKKNRRYSELIQTGSSETPEHSQWVKSAGNKSPHTSYSTSTAVESPISTQPAAQRLNPKKDKNEELTWVGKEHLSVFAKSIYLVKFVREDSTTESDPFNLLKSTCSLAFNIDFRFVMKPCEEKQWHVSVVMKHENGNILVGEARASTCADARTAAAQDAVHNIQANCRVVEPNFKYFAEGGIPSFVSLKNPLKTSTYEIMVMDDIKSPLSQQVVNLVLEMFIDDNTVEDLFFLASDYSNEERELVRKTSIQYGLCWRLFGQRSRAASPDDIVSTQHVCVFRSKSAEQLVQQLITCGGSTDKYSIVTRHNVTSQHMDEIVTVAELPPDDLIEICDNEDLPGGCCNPRCSLTHQNILDTIVNQFLGM